MKKEIEIQQENLNTLVKLMKENPTLEVMPMVDSEVVASDDYSWWLGRFGEAELDECWFNDERIYFRSWDEEELIEDAIEDFGYNPKLDGLSDEELNKMAEERVNKLGWEKVILVKINMP
nr:MAG TPA: hypothetical protein [Caudoviricetes sp.]